jgi:hypothetical protein
MTISPAFRLPVPAAPVAQPARPTAAAQPRPAVAAQPRASTAPAEPAAAPAGADPALWSVLTADERAFFAQGTQAVTYAAPDRGTPAPASRLGQRLDVRV